MNAIQLANELEVVSWKDAQTEAADMLRRQHEVIVKLRGVCQLASSALPDVGRVQKALKAALEETEEMK